MSVRVPAAAAFAPALALALLAGTPAASAQSAPTARQPTIGDLASRKVEVHRDTMVSANVSRAMENYRRFLELQNTDPKLRAEALRRLGDLNLDAGEMQRLEQEVTAVDLQGAEAIKLYTTLLKAFPDYARNDQVLYQLARAYETTGQSGQALGTLDRIVQRYPQSPQLDEVQFRRGELLFSDKRYADAERAYAAVIGRGAGSAFFQQSLYKRGWSLFKQSQALESLPSFGGVLDQELGAGRGKSVRLETLKRADRELVEDTLRVMSITFSYNDGAASLEQYMSQHGERPYAWLLYSRLGDLYVDKQRYQDAASVYRAYVARDPYSDHAPDLDMAAIEAYGKGGFSQLVFDGKHEFVEHYNFDSPYWKPRSRADNPRVVQELKTNLKDVATYFHASAQKSKRVADYQEAARWYRDYLKSFPEDADSAATDYLLAEALFESHQYADAAAEYEHTAYGYPRNEKSATAAYAALVSYQKGEEGLSGADKDAWHKRAMDAGVRFAQSFPEHPDSAGVLTRAAEEIFAAGDQPRAVSVSESILARQPPVDAAKQRIAWTIIAQARFDQGDYAKAEPAFLQARELAGKDDKMRADLTERLAASVYKEGEAKQKAGDGGGAVEDFLRVGRVAPESKIRANAQYDAAAELLTLKEWERAIGVLQDFRRQFPQHQLQPEVARKLAVAYSEANRPGEAAAEFERIASTNTARRCRGGAPAPGGLRRQERRWRAARSLVPGDHPRRRAGRRAAHRSHPLPGREGAAGARAAGARCVSCGASDCAAQEEPHRQARRARACDGRLQARRRVPGRRGHYRRHLRDGGAVRRARQGHPGLGAAREAQGRCAGGIQLTARGAGISVRGAGDQGARAERRARQGRGVRRVGAQELPGARAAQARALRQNGADAGCGHQPRIRARPAARRLPRSTRGASQLWHSRGWCRWHLPPAAPSLRAPPHARRPRSRSRRRMPQRRRRR
ncbi:MAG: tetratricopeptide repeat protein [Gammaproteobacteria bacterium]|nr:MAG: tetratricopeptide repeat protein [Gammaproteobacteria bacterium]